MEELKEKLKNIKKLQRIRMESINFNFKLIILFY